MKLKTVTSDEVKLLAPENYVVPKTIPDCCGAGSGLGEKLVPEKILGLRISAACHIHDFSWSVATENDFDLTNTLFLVNLIRIIRVKSKNKLVRILRNYRAVTYYNAVQEFGRTFFENDRT